MGEVKGQRADGGPVAAIVCWMELSGEGCRAVLRGETTINYNDSNGMKT